MSFDTARIFLRKVLVILSLLIIAGFCLASNPVSASEEELLGCEKEKLISLLKDTFDENSL